MVDRRIHTVAETNKGIGDGYSGSCNSEYHKIRSKREVLFRRAISLRLW